MTPERLEEIREALSTDNPAPLHRTLARELLTAYDSLRGEAEMLRGALVVIAADGCYPCRRQAFNALKGPEAPKEPGK